MDQIALLTNRYVDWLRDDISINEAGEWLEITLPYLDRHNDYIQVYARLSDNNIKLMDDGYIISDLEGSGCSLDTPRRRRMLDSILKGFGVHLGMGNSLSIETSAEDFPLALHSLVQAMLATGDLIHTAQPNVKALFLEDVGRWLSSLDIEHQSGVMYTGKSGYDRKFDFAVLGPADHQLHLIQAMAKPDRNSADGAVLSWIDTEQSRPQSIGYALLNDQEEPIPTGVIEELNRYSLRTYGWSQRGEMGVALSSVAG